MTDTRDPRKQECKVTRGSCPDDSEDGNSMKRGGKVEEDAVWGGGGAHNWKKITCSVLFYLDQITWYLSTLMYKALCWLQQSMVIHEIPLIITAKNDKFNLHTEIYTETIKYNSKSYFFQV